MMSCILNTEVGAGVGVIVGVRVMVGVKVGGLVGIGVGVVVMVGVAVGFSGIHLLMYGLLTQNRTMIRMSTIKPIKILKMISRGFRDEGTDSFREIGKGVLVSERFLDTLVTFVC